jgi:hypothetical protein
MAPTFTNMPPLQSIEATTPMEMLEADCVDLSKYPMLKDGKQFKHVLLVICVMSR